MQLLTRQQELSISRSSAIGNADHRPGGDAAGPVKARKALIILFGMMIGLLLSAGTV
jgi:tyrosine-protein kinase Etk/Wzc